MSQPHCVQHGILFASGKAAHMSGIKRKFCGILSVTNGIPLDSFDVSNRYLSLNFDIPKVSVDLGSKAKCFPNSIQVPVLPHRVTSECDDIILLHQGWFQTRIPRIKIGTDPVKLAVISKRTFFSLGCVFFNSVKEFCLDLLR